MIAFTKKISNRNFFLGLPKETLVLVKRDLKKYWKKIIIDFDSNNNTYIALDRSFYSFLTTAYLKNKSTPSRCLKKNDNCIYLAVIANARESMFNFDVNNKFWWHKDAVR